MSHVLQPTSAPTVDVVGLVRAALAASAGDLERALAELGPDDRRRQRALDRWFAGFADQLRSHHELVDTMIAPALARRGGLDQRALDTLAADHAWVDQLLSELGDALGVLSFGLGDEETWIRRASDRGMALNQALDGQLRREQRMLAPLVDQHFTADEQEVLRYESMRHVAAGRGRFSLGWLYSQIDPEERAVVSAYAPAARRLTWRSQCGAYRRSTGAALG